MTQKTKWWAVLIAASVFMLWIAFGTHSSENVVLDDGPDSNSAAQEQTNEPAEPVDQNTEQNQEPAEPTEPEQPTEPETPDLFAREVTIDLDDSWGNVDASQTESAKSFTYTHNDGSELVITISESEVSLDPADFRWTHTVTEGSDGSFTLSEILDESSSLCTEGDPDCSAGNGVLDISSYNTGSGLNVYIKITDTEQEIGAATSYYRPIIESIQIS